MKQGAFHRVKHHLGLVLLSLIAQKSYAQNQSIPQALMPVTLAASELSILYGQKLESLHVYTQFDQQLHSVTHQWTQLTDEKTLYSPKFKDIEFSGNLERLDQYDQLRMMFLELGPQSCASLVQSSEVFRNNPKAKVIEFEVQPKAELQGQPLDLQGQPSDLQGQPSDLQGQPSFVCITNIDLQIHENPNNYAEFKPSTYNIQSEYYSLFLSRDNPLIWHDFFYKDVNLKQTDPFYGSTILDSLKIAIDAGLFSEATRVHLDNSDLDSKIKQIIHGPISDQIFILTKVKLAGANVLDMQITMEFFANHAEMTTRFKVPNIARYIVKTPKVDVSLDAYNMWGGFIKSSWGPDQPLKVDGVMSPQEIEFGQKEVSGENAWIWFSTQKGFDVLTFIEFDRAFNVPIALVYNDDKTQVIEPERFPGQGPNVGYSIRGMVIGRYFTFKTDLQFSTSLQPNYLDSRVAILKAPWSIKQRPYN